MTDAPLSRPEADELLAIEWALGLLDGAERDAAERRASGDADLALLFRRWEALAFAMLDGREERPAAKVWTAIARHLPGNANGASVRRWQAATAIAASVALALGATLALNREPTPAPTGQVTPVRPLVAVLASPERDAVVAVSFVPAGALVSVLPRGLTTDGRDAELWVIPAGGKPIAAGLLLPDARTSLRPGTQIASLMVPGATLAISLEPRGGSRTGAPTGPVILTGIITRS